MASIKQYRGNTWRAIVRRKGHPPQSKTFEKKSDAEKWAAGIEASLGASKYDALQLKQAKITTVKDIFQRYLDEVAPDMKGRNAIGTIKRLMRDAPFMNIRISAIIPRNVRDWRDARVKKVSPQSVNRELNAVSGVLTHAIKEWSIPLEINPCSQVTRFKGVDVERDSLWTQDDVDAFLKACKWETGQVPKKGRDYVAWALLISIETAMREGEICLPLVKDFYPAERYVFLKDTKNGDERKVPLSLKALDYFNHLCKDRKPEEKIFPICANTLCEYVLDVRVACKLEHLHFHDARHTAATAMSKKLANVLELSAVTGHRSLKALKRYYHPSPADIGSKLD